MRASTLISPSFWRSLPRRRHEPPATFAGIQSPFEAGWPYRRRRHRSITAFGSAPPASADRPTRHALPSAGRHPDMRSTRRTWTIDRSLSAQRGITGGRYGDHARARDRLRSPAHPRRRLPAGRTTPEISPVPAHRIIWRRSDRDPRRGVGACLRGAPHLRVGRARGAVCARPRRRLSAREALRRSAARTGRVATPRPVRGERAITAEVERPAWPRELRMEVCKQRKAPSCTNLRHDPWCRGITALCWRRPQARHHGTIGSVTPAGSAPGTARRGDHAVHDRCCASRSGTRIITRPWLREASAAVEVLLHRSA